MRSRYAAYARGLVDYVLRTAHPDGPHAQDRAGVEAFCRSAAFVRLEVLSATADGDRGEVRFRAHLQQGGRPQVLEEHSLFVREHGRWLYHSAVR